MASPAEIFIRQYYTPTPQKQIFRERGPTVPLEGTLGFLLRDNPYENRYYAPGTAETLLKEEPYLREAVRPVSRLFAAAKEYFDSQYKLHTPPSNFLGGLSFDPDDRIMGDRDRYTGSIFLDPVAIQYMTDAESGYPTPANYAGRLLGTMLHELAHGGGFKDDYTVPIGRAPVEEYTSELLREAWKDPKIQAAAEASYEELRKLSGSIRYNAPRAQANTRFKSLLNSSWRATLPEEHP